MIKIKPAAAVVMASNFVNRILLSTMLDTINHECSPRKTSLVRHRVRHRIFHRAGDRDCSPAAVIRIDPSADQLAFAKRAGVSMAEFHVGDAQDLPFSNNSFDIVVMALVIHFVPSPGKALSEMSRVLRPGGWAAAYVWDYTKSGSPTAPLSAAMKVIGLQSPGPPSPNATSLPALEELWRTSGFVQIGTRTINIPVKFTHFEEFWNSTTMPVGPVGKAIAQLSPNDRDRLRGILQERMPLTANGRVIYEARANAIKGRKTP